MISKTKIVRTHENIIDYGVTVGNLIWSRTCGDEAVIVLARVSSKTLSHLDNNDQVGQVSTGSSFSVTTDRFQESRIRRNYRCKCGCCMSVLNVFIVPLISTGYFHVEFTPVDCRAFAQVKEKGVNGFVLILIGLEISYCNKFCPVRYSRHVPLEKCPDDNMLVYNWDASNTMNHTVFTIYRESRLEY